MACPDSKQRDKSADEGASAYGVPVAGALFIIGCVSPRSEMLVSRLDNCIVQRCRNQQNPSPAVSGNEPPNQTIRMLLSATLEPRVSSGVLRMLLRFAATDVPQIPRARHGPIKQYTGNGNTEKERRPSRSNEGSWMAARGPTTFVFDGRTSNAAANCPLRAGPKPVHQIARHGCWRPTAPVAPARRVALSLTRAGWHPPSFHNDCQLAATSPHIRSPPSKPSTRYPDVRGAGQDAR